MTDLMTIQGIDCYERDGTAYLRLEAVARGLGFARIAASGNEVVRWETVRKYLSEFGACQQVGTEDSPLVGKEGLPDFIPENIFYRLAMKAKNDVAEAFQAKIADEVIPAIRKTGSYHMPGAAEDAPRNEYLRMAEMLSKTPESHLPYVLELFKLGGIDLSAAVQPGQGPGASLGITAVQPAIQPGNAPADPWHAREFLADILPRATWDLLPYALLRALYIGWMRRHYPGVAHIGGNRNKFIKGLMVHADLACEYGWAFVGLARTRGRMDGEEPLIVEFGCTDGYLLDCRGKDPASVKRAKNADRRRGLCRMAA